MAKPPSPVVTPLVDPNAPAVQKGQAVVTSAKYGAIRHSAVDGATVHTDTEVSAWLSRDNPDTH